jgi:hypothetical protein
MKAKLWVVYFVGNDKDKAGICFWGKWAQGQFFETKQRARFAMEREFEEWGPKKGTPLYKIRNKVFKIVRCTVSLKVDTLH